LLWAKERRLAEVSESAIDERILAARSCERCFKIFMAGEYEADETGTGRTVDRLLLPNQVARYCISQIRRRILDLVMPAEGGIQMRRSAESELDSGLRRNDGIRHANCGAEYSVTPGELASLPRLVARETGCWKLMGWKQMSLTWLRLQGMPRKSHMQVMHVPER
jgi:hypothetical protein